MSLNNDRNTTPPTVGPQTSTILIKPRAIERPALGYALTWRAEETQEGNAAVRYMAAVEQLPRHTPEESDLLDKLLRGPLAELDETAAKRATVLLEANTDTRYLFIDGRAVPLDTRHSQIYMIHKDRR